MTADIATEIAECAGLLSDEAIATRERDRVRRRLHHLADRARASDSPFLTITAAARRYHIDRKEFRRLIADGRVQVTVVAGRERVDIRQFEEW